MNKDAFNYLKNADDLYDVILVDLPDPNNESLINSILGNSTV
ncbi:hypothetical protein [Peribacillus simplex]